MKKLLLLGLLCTFSLQADYVKNTAAACLSKATLIELNEYSGNDLEAKDPLELELWLLSHECRIIEKKVAIEVLDYTGKKTEILKILLKKSRKVMYVPYKAIQIEQPGQNDVIYKF